MSQSETSREMFVGRLPGRKRRAMWVENNGVIRPLAYFCDDKAFETFKAITAGNGLRYVPPVPVGVEAEHTPRGQA